MCFTLQQNRHPERSALQIYRITKGLVREVEGPPRCLPADAVRSFLTTNQKSHKLRPERSGAEGPAVLRTLPGNVFRRSFLATTRKENEKVTTSERSQSLPACREADLHVDLARVEARSAGSRRAAQSERTA